MLKRGVKNYKQSRNLRILDAFQRKLGKSQPTRGATHVNNNKIWIFRGSRRQGVSSACAPNSNLPLFLQSNRCNLAFLSPQQLIEHNEHEQEWGGYFIVKGNERLIRMLLSTRRNYPVAVKRRTWKQRAANFSEYGIMIRCVAEDQASSVN